MKKFFSLVAIAALVFGMASCEKKDQPTEPAVKSDEFGIKVTKITENSVTFDIIPSDKSATYDFVIIPASEKDEFDLGLAQNASEIKAREGGSLYVGDLKGAQIGDLMSEMEYAIAAYIVDTITGHGSNEATFAIFTTEAVKVSKTVEFNDQQAKMIDYTSMGLDVEGGDVHHFWTVEATYKDYLLKLHSGSTMEILGSYDALQLAETRVEYDGTSHAIKTGELTVSGDKLAFEISGHLIDDANVRFNLNIKVTDYEEGGTTPHPDDDPIGDEGAGGVE